MKILFAFAGLILASSCSQSDGQVDVSDKQVDVIEAAAAPSGSAYLVIELPDGVRGGVGSIRGQGNDQLWGPYESEVNRLADCGAVNPQLKNVWSHSVHIISRSTENDLDVVQCFTKTTARHFNVGIGFDPTLQDSSIDRSKFENIYRNANSERPS